MKKSSFIVQFFRGFADYRVWVYAVLMVALIGVVYAFEIFGGMHQVTKFLGYGKSASSPEPPALDSRDAYFPFMDELIMRLDLLEEREFEVSYAQRVLDWEIRVQLADQILRYPLTVSDRHDTLVSKMESLIGLAETRNLGSRAKLLQSINEYRFHPDEHVRRLAAIGAAELAIIDFLKTAQGEWPPVVDRIGELLRGFPRDIQVARFLEGQATVLVSRQFHDAAAEILTLMHETYQSSPNLVLQSLAETLPDRIFLVQIRFDQTVDRLRSQRPGALETFFEAISKIASNPNAGIFAYQEVARAAAYFEQLGQLDYARDVYQLLERRLAHHPDARIARAADVAGKRGMVRLDSLGHLVELRGTKPDGTLISPESYADKLVVLYFWRSHRSAESFQTAVNLNSAMRDFRNSPVVFFGICADSDLESQVMTTFNKIPNWQLKLDDHMQTVEMLQTELGIPEEPYVTVLDHTGKIRAINVSAPQLRDCLQTLLRAQRQTSQTSDQPSTTNRTRTGRRGAIQ